MPWQVMALHPSGSEGGMVSDVCRLPRVLRGWVLDVQLKALPTSIGILSLMCPVASSA